MFSASYRFIVVHLHAGRSSADSERLVPEINEKYGAARLILILLQSNFVLCAIKVLSPAIWIAALAR